MVQFALNTARIHPFKNFKFRVIWDGRPVAGISKVSPLKRSTGVVSHREGGDNVLERYSPGRSKYEPVTLERGVTFDREFETWANLVYSTEGDGAISLANFRKDISIEVLNLQGTVVQRYTLFRCWVSEFTALPDLDANAEAIMIESIQLQIEGFERDIAVVETAET